MSTTLAEPVSRPWRRFLRFSVRGMIVLILAIAGVLGWWLRNVRVQRDAVAAILSAGGSVEYDQIWTDWAFIPRERRWTSRSLADLVGADHFGHVTTVSLHSSSTACDAALARIGRLTRLQRLRLSGSSVSDAGLVHLKGLGNLLELDLSSTQVSDAGLVHLKGLGSLRHLDLRHTQVSKTGLDNLEGLGSLGALFVRGTHVTDAGVKDAEQTLASAEIIR